MGFPMLYHKVSKKQNQANRKKMSTAHQPYNTSAFIYIEVPYCITVIKHTS